MKRTLILGLGNPLQGDDGVGCHIAETLQRQMLSDDGEVIDGGTPGIGLLNLFEGRQCVIIIDAAEIGLPAGEYRRFEPHEVVLTGSNQRFSLHRTGVIDALALARELNIALPKIVFFGVQPQSVEWRNGLSPRVQAAVPRVIEAILYEMEGSQSEKV